MSVLQIALDLVDLEKALDIAERICSGLTRRVLVEAGTPLIKSVGIEAVRKLAEICTGKEIVADLKIVDAAKVEASLAFEAGADYVTVLALAGKDTIMGVIETAREYGGRTIIDLIHVHRPLDVIPDMKQLRPDVVCFHIGVDTQRSRGISVESLIREIKVAKNLLKGVKVAAAGGVTPEIARRLVEVGADIVVVGGYITSAEDPLLAAREVLSSMEE